MVTIEESFNLLNGLENNIANFPSLTEIRTPDSYHMADWIYEKLMEQIYEFESTLDEQTEIAMRLTNFGNAITLYVTDIGYQNPDLLYFYGIADGKPAQLVQHINQLNFLLISVPKQNPDQPLKRIGFVLPSEDPEDQ